jgi:hypothetical protein
MDWFQSTKAGDLEVQKLESSRYLVTLITGLLERAALKQ